ncbi:hypothetical protein BHM03_00046400 [Ensete ventricosum]|nr:hypothetical protein BHM03_00046400 [Ensete ventricosum]
MASPLQGRSTTCKGVAGCGQAPYKGWPAAARPPARGGRLKLRPPCKGAAGCDQAPYKGRPPAARGSPAARATACKGDHWQERPPTREVPHEGSSTCRRGGCPRRRRAAPPTAQGSGDGGGADGGKERARASF